MNGRLHLSSQPCESSRTFFSLGAWPSPWHCSEPGQKRSGTSALQPIGGLHTGQTQGISSCTTALVDGGRRGHLHWEGLEGWTCKEPCWKRRKSWMGMSKATQPSPTSPKSRKVLLRSRPFLCRSQSMRACVSVRSCPLPASLPVLIWNNQEETPGVSWLLHTFFMHRGAPSP